MFSLLGFGWSSSKQLQCKIIIEICCALMHLPYLFNPTMISHVFSYSAGSVCFVLAGGKCSDEPRWKGCLFLHWGPGGVGWDDLSSSARISITLYLLIKLFYLSSSLSDKLSWSLTKTEFSTYWTPSFPSEAGRLVTEMCWRYWSVRLLDYSIGIAVCYKVSSKTWQKYTLDIRIRYTLYVYSHNK